MINPRSLANLKPVSNFSKDNQPVKKGGRRPTIYKQYAKPVGITVGEFKNIIKNILFVYTLDDYKKFSPDKSDPEKLKDVPAFMSLIVTTLSREASNGRGAFMLELFKYLFPNKPQIEISGTVNNVNLSLDLTEEEKAQLRKNLESFGIQSDNPENQG
jgi:hypothetical protein